MILIIKINTCQ